MLEFVIPPTDAYKIKSAELTYTINNGADRAGNRTYDIYASDIVIDESLTNEALKALQLGDSMYTGEGLAKGATRIDTVSSSSIRDYVKSKVNANDNSKIQFAFSNSSQPLNIDPVTAELRIVVYDGGIALNQNELTPLSNGESTELTVGIYSEGIDESNFVWSSANSEIASVESGLVTPHKAGTTTIAAYHKRLFL